MERQLRVLVVEGDANTARLLLDALRATGCVSEAAWVTDGAEAVDFLLGRGLYREAAPPPPPHAVILGRQIALVSGEELQVILARDPRLKTIQLFSLDHAGYARKLTRGSVEELRAALSELADPQPPDSSSASPQPPDS